ncbi:NTP transferase domain-containing protein [Pacificimonas sp. ICDLI1SI03]
MKKNDKLVTALLLAGARPAHAERGLGRGNVPKPLIEIGGRSMLRRVVDALLQTPSIGATRIISQRADEMVEKAGLGTLGVEAKVSGNSVSAAVRAELDGCWPYLVTTADHALLTPALLETFLAAARASKADVCFAVVERKTLMARFPESKRTWLKFRGGAYSGANLFFLAHPSAAAAVDLWQSVEQDRKASRAIVAAFGPLLLLGVVMRLLSLQQALRFAGRRLGCTVEAVILDEAEAAIDVDTESDLLQVTSILKQREEPSVRD